MVFYKRWCTPDRSLYMNYIILLLGIDKWIIIFFYIIELPIILAVRSIFISLRPQLHFTLAINMPHLHHYHHHHPHLYCPHTLTTPTSITTPPSTPHFNHSHLHHHTSINPTFITPTFITPNSITPTHITPTSIAHKQLAPPIHTVKDCPMSKGSTKRGIPTHVSSGTLNHVNGEYRFLVGCISNITMGGGVSRVSVAADCWRKACMIVGGMLGTVGVVAWWGEECCRCWKLWPIRLVMLRVLVPAGVGSCGCWDTVGVWGIAVVGGYDCWELVL